MQVHERTEGKINHWTDKQHLISSALPPTLGNLLYTNIQIHQFSNVSELKMCAIRPFFNLGLRLEEILSTAERGATCAQARNTSSNKQQRVGWPCLTKDRQGK